MFALIDPEQFAACFRQLSASVAELLPDEIVAVDGKRVGNGEPRGAWPGRDLGEIQ
ncbi:hypothetical protein [Thiocapsa marina]|uniref:hypothetical protein n=1 Tax=Thiocapsa marina TaxID=244573 RepID=UPI0002F6D962|nr:hypothetical protein [Thiocapsa marina]